MASETATRTNPSPHNRRRLWRGQQQKALAWQKPRDGKKITPVDFFLREAPLAAAVEGAFYIP